MRIAVTIIGLIMSLFFFVQAFIGGIAGDLSNDEEFAGAAALAMLASLIWLVSSALAIPFPRISMSMFMVAGFLCLIGASAGTAYEDLWFWMVASFVLALFSYFGYRGNRKDQREKQAERDRQLERDQRLEYLMEVQAKGRASATPLDSCSNCGATVSRQSRFCADCGAARAAATST